MNYMFYEEHKGLSHQLKRMRWDKVEDKYIETDIFPNTFAESIMFNDGELLQDKLDSGALSGTFAISKTYSSIEEMNADFTGADVKVGELVIIASSESDLDNAKLFVKTKEKYSFIADLSGAPGIVGPQGIQGEKGDIGITPSIEHLERQVASAVTATESSTQAAVKQVDNLVGTIAPTQGDIDDIIGMIGGL